MKVEDVINLIGKRAVVFTREYGIPPHDVVLGPEEFSLLAEQAQLPDSDPSSVYRLELATHFISGMRIRLASSSGILVGVLTAKE